MNYDQLCAAILKVLPRATLDEDNDGQIVIYTDCKVVWTQEGEPGGPFLTADVVPLTDEEGITPTTTSMLKREEE